MRKITDKELRGMKFRGNNNRSYAEVYKLLDTLEIGESIFVEPQDIDYVGNLNFVDKNKRFQSVVRHRATKMKRFYKMAVVEKETGWVITRTK